MTVVLVSPQISQTEVTEPLSVQVAGMVVVSYLGPVLAIGSVLITLWQMVQVYVFSPSSSQVGSLVTTPPSLVCPVGAISSVLIISLQAVQVYVL